MIHYLILKKIANEYKIKTVIFTNDLKFAFNLVDKIIINEKDIVKFLNGDFYNDEIYNYIEMPEIIDFVKSSKYRKIALDNYLEISDLLKGINRL